MNTADKHVFPLLPPVRSYSCLKGLASAKMGSKSFGREGIFHGLRSLLWRLALLQAMTQASPPHMSLLKFRFCPSCELEVEVSEEDLAIVCTRCGMVLEQSSVSDNPDHLDKGSSESGSVVSAINKGMVYLGSGVSFGRPLMNRSVKYKVRTREKRNNAALFGPPLRLQ